MDAEAVAPGPDEVKPKGLNLDLVQQLSSWRVDDEPANILEHLPSSVRRPEPGVVDIHERAVSAQVRAATRFPYVTDRNAPVALRP